MRKFVLNNDHQIRLSVAPGINVRFCDMETGRCWGSVTANGILTIFKGYGWDGCSPKIRIGSVVLGVWDGPPDPSNKGLPLTWEASLVHDLLCQFEKHPQMFMTRKMIDDEFKKILIQKKFAKAERYYLAVRWLGRPYSTLLRYSKWLRRLIKLRWSC